jgi:hypothetical protein
MVAILVVYAARLVSRGVGRGELLCAMQLFDEMPVGYQLTLLCLYCFGTGFCYCQV